MPGFNVGDVVEAIDNGMTNTPKGSIGTITRVWFDPIIPGLNDYRTLVEFVDVDFGTHRELGRVSSRFTLSTRDSSAVERKIKRIYERQYRKTDYAYLL